MAIPYGLLADRKGRKSTLLLGLPGFALNSVIVLAVMWFSDIFPLRAIWFSSLAWLLGGGPVVAFAIIWTMMADVTTEEERYLFSLLDIWIPELINFRPEQRYFSNSASFLWEPISFLALSHLT